VDVLRERALSGDFATLVAHALRWVGTALRPAGGRGLPGPALGTLLVTYRCDLRCRVCDLPARAAQRRRAGDRELSTAEFETVLRDMKAIGTAGVGFTGGEPMLREDTPHLLAYATRLGLHAHLNSDGYRVAEEARRLLRAGVRTVNISLDGPDAAGHDQARGRAGSFAKATDALRTLRKARGKRRGPRLTAVTVLTAFNVAEVGRVAEVALAAGADRLGVIPVHDFGQGERRPDEAALAAGLSALRALERRGLVDNSPAYLDLIPRAFRGDASPLRCYAPHTSVVVDCYGDVYPCFPLMERREPIGRLPLKPLWRGAAYARERERLAGCRACLWNCHAEMNLLFPQGRDARAATPATEGVA